MIKNRYKAALAVLALSLATSTLKAVVSDDLGVEADHAILAMVNADSALTNLFDHSAGFAVFPGAGKGGVVFGGLYGKGLLYENGKPVGRAKVHQLNFGLQMGGQSFYEVVFFENAATLQRFKKAPFETCAEMSAIAISKGASLNPRYREGVVIYALPRAGFMAQAAIAAQKFSYQPFN